jgi:lipoprotein-anchoring transpeptidase ErfK/SrfK
MGSANSSAATKVVQGLLIAGLTLAAAIPALAQAAPSPQDLATRTVLVSIPDRKLAVIEDGEVLATFQIAVGAEKSPSPTGELGLSEKGYGIHGTNMPWSVGHAASHGCIRLRNHDAERLFGMLRVGDLVKIRGERDDEIAQVFGGGDDDEIAEMEEPEQQSGK